MLCSNCSYNNPVAEKFCKNCDIALQHSSDDAVRAVDSDELVHAGFWVRFLAAFLDILVVGACVILIIFSIAALIAYSGRENILQHGLFQPFFYGVIVLLVLGYTILMESSADSATLGKRWMNLKVLDTVGNKLTLTRAMARFIARLFALATLAIGFMIQPFTRRKQALHDLLAGTIVTRTNASRKISIMATLLVLFMALMVPVLAIFSTAGMPIFQRHILNVQMNHALRTGTNAALAVARYYHNNGRVPAAISDTGVKIRHSPHISGIEINQMNGEITVAFSATVRKHISNKHLVFTPSLEADQSIRWKCHSANIEMQYLADACK